MNELLLHSRHLASLRSFRGYTEDEAELAAWAADEIDWHRRGLDMVRRIATFGPGPETTPEQTLDVIRVWAEKRLAKLCDD